LFNSKIGDEFETTGPHGLFKLNNSDRPALFLAAGTGITPLMTMIESLKDSDREMTLIYSAKKKEDLIFLKKLQELSNSKRLKFIPTLTQEGAEGWKTGRITQELIGEAISHPTESYICGMPEFVNSAKEFLKQLNFDEKDIHTERW
jgi:ferredoxin-NADP reductase